MDYFRSAFVGEPFRDEINHIPTWAKSEHLEKTVPQKELWHYGKDTPGSSGCIPPVICRFVALALFVAATFLIADDRILLGVMAFLAAAWLMNVEKPDPDTKEMNERHCDAGKRRNGGHRRMRSPMESAH